MASNDVVIVAAYRTPIGSFNGSFSSLKADELGSIVLKRILEETNTVPDDVIIGQALTAGQGQNPARQTVIKSGCPNTVTATTINMLCGSGLKSCALGYQALKCGDAKVVVCGGQESMSQAPHCIHLRNGTKMNDTTMVDSMIKDGLTDAFLNIHMGNTADHVAKEFSIGREDQDEHALSSQLKYQEASHFFVNEIVPVSIKIRREEKVIKVDEYPKSNCTIDQLKKLRPCFTDNGTVTPGNASGINDGAALLMLTTQSEAKSRNLKPLVRIVSWAQTGCDPILMGVGPIDSIKLAVKKADWSLNDIDIFEINEAFSSQSLAILKELNLDASKVNVSGGSIAIGHPIGASGARCLVTLIHTLIRLKKQRGLVALCIGGGMSISMCIELTKENLSAQI